MSDRKTRKNLKRQTKVLLLLAGVLVLLLLAGTLFFTIPVDWRTDAVIITEPARIYSSAPVLNQDTTLGSQTKPYVTTDTESLDQLKIEMVAVQGGTFSMGSDEKSDFPRYFDDGPVHQVTLSDFYIGKFEVTQALWKAVMGSNPSSFKGDNLPVENVSWKDVNLFILKLNSMTGKQYRLPTESEWEFAAGGGISSKHFKFSGSNTADNVAWFDQNSGNKTHPVGSKTANELGIHDMSGNVWEWCSDWYRKYFENAQTNPKGPSSGYDRIRRGGAWNFDAYRVRVTFRDLENADIGSSTCGFRLACDIK
ncbi:MAG: formylglycine-generating enzyme family protein [Tannerella sp.]|jgi:formylglycine-generating enzyme required for sulfatase activity|nr:formylglycine-generating enzyme family protein [Tannerella sp.]